MTTIEKYEESIGVKRNLPIMLDEGAIMPTKAYESDAGFDLYSRENKIVPAGGNVTFDTGVHIRIPAHHAGVLISKSGLNVKNDLTSTGLIDCGYCGSIRVKLYNHGKRDYVVYAGDKISQIVIIHVTDFEPYQVYETEETERGNNGFGSSGR